MGNKKSVPQEKADEFALVRQQERNLDLINRRMAQENQQTFLALEKRKVDLIKEKMDYDKQLTLVKLNTERMEKENAFMLDRRNLELTEKKIEADRILDGQRLNIAQMEKQNAHEFWMSTIKIPGLVLALTVFLAFTTGIPIGFIFGGR